MKRIHLAVDDTYVGAGLVVIVTFPFMGVTKTVRVHMGESDALELVSKVRTALARAGTPRLGA